VSLDLQGNFLGVKDTLERGGGSIIAFDDLFVHMLFGDQFEDRLEEVGVEAQVLVEAV
jgi:hypothetical protein